MNKSFKIFSAGLLAAMMSATAPALAQSNVPSGSPNMAATPDQVQQTPAGKFIQDLGNQAIAIMKDKSLTAEQRSSHYRDLLRTAFDLPAIGRFVIGRSAWASATPEQQQEYMKLFEELVLKTYGDRLNFYTGEEFQVKSVRQESDNDIVVLSQITHPDGSTATAIDWRVRNKDGKLAVIDVVVEGVSQSVTQRQEYSSIIQNDGGKIDGLLVLMRQRLQQATPQTPATAPANPG